VLDEKENNEQASFWTTWKEVPPGVGGLFVRAGRARTRRAECSVCPDVFTRDSGGKARDFSCKKVFDVLFAFTREYSRIF
jgi:hypothetical protein